MDTKEKRWQRYLAQIKAFRLMDDDFMTKCFEDNTECVELMLKIILNKSDLKVIEAKTQVFILNLKNRSVRLDVLATDNEGQKYNIEIQRANSGAGFKRARYNSSMIDASQLLKGSDFDELPETYVILITEKDILGKGLPLYKIERTILNTGERFNDGAHILYVNGAYRGDTPVGKLMHDFSCTEPSDMNYEVLSNRVKFFKESKEGVAIMCRAIEEMRIEERREVARRMLTTGKLSIEEIANCADLPIEEVKKLQNEKTA